MRLTVTPVSRPSSLRTPVGDALDDSVMRPSATSCCMRATDAGAARNSGRRCTCTMLVALPVRSTTQSSAESPPPKITSRLPWKSDALRTR